MEHYDNHGWHWWHWLIIVIVVIVCLGIGYTLINNYKIVKRDDQSIVEGTEQVIEHPINTTQNAIKDVTNQ